MLKVLIVDDSVVIRKILSDVIGADPELEVVGTAANGVIAMNQIDRLAPDIVTLDIEMPEMDGLETLSAIRAIDRKLPVIMFSTLSTRGAEVTLEALALGASDYVAKPANVGRAKEAFDQVANELLPLLKLFGRNGHGRSVTPSPPVQTRCATDDDIRAVLVGSSTGGPVALDTMLSSIEEPLAVPMLVVQHMPPKFTLSLAQRLDRRTVHRVVEGADGAIVEPGTIYIAPGGRHMTVKEFAGRPRLKVHDGPLVNFCRPSVDVLFESATDLFGADQLGVILTGMGHDGRAGAQLLTAAGGDVFAQDEATSVVWGMPGAVVEDELACQVLPIEQMGAAIRLRVGSPASAKLSQA